jgi:hypothetical protein
MTKSVTLGKRHRRRRSYPAGERTRSGIHRLQLAGWVKPGRTPPITGDDMRQLRHILIGICAWLALAGLWVLLGLQHKLSLASFRDTLLQLAAIVGLVLAITAWWVRHNVGIYRRKGPRQGRADIPPITDADKLGRPIRWAMPGDVRAARASQHLIVEVDGDVKTYRRGP